MSDKEASELLVDGLDAAYGASQVLFGVKLEVERGETLALMGRNGAGKSTTFKAIAGLLPPRAGRVMIRGQDVAGQKPYRIARAGIAYVPEDRQVFPEHSVEENLEIAEREGGAAASGTARAPSRCSPCCNPCAPAWRAGFPAASSRCSPSPAA